MVRYLLPLFVTLFICVFSVAKADEFLNDQKGTAKINAYETQLSDHEHVSQAQKNAIKRKLAQEQISKMTGVDVHLDLPLPQAPHDMDDRLFDEID